MHWILLLIGISIEIFATIFLKMSDGFAKLGYAGLTLLCFGAAFYVMALVVRTMPLAIAYSVWAGGGIAGVAIVGAFVFGQKLDSGKVHAGQYLKTSLCPDH